MMITPPSNLASLDDHQNSIDQILLLGEGSRSKGREWGSTQTEYSHKVVLDCNKVIQKQSWRNKPVIRQGEGRTRSDRY